MKPKSINSLMAYMRDQKNIQIKGSVQKQKLRNMGYFHGYKGYRFYGTPKEEPHGPEYRLVSVRFSASGRTYDYISEDSSIQTGDHVIVEGYDGETEVEVIKVAVKRESELGIPVERYKRIVRKGVLRKG